MAGNRKSGAKNASKPVLSDKQRVLVDSATEMNVATVRSFC
jgi:hypothetical protein